jgi:hypothetical protein
MAMGRQRAQVLIIFTAALPALLGLLGLALDGGYYFAAGRATQFAADAAARAVTVEIMNAQYDNATAAGQAMGRKNLDLLKLSGVSIALAYNNTVNAAPTASGWSATPSTTTRSIRATASGSYATLFLQLLQVGSVDLQRVAVVTIDLNGWLPIAICTPTSDAMNAQPDAPQVIWQFNGNLCGVAKWDGLASLNGQTGCAVYERWILPEPPSGPPPALGSDIALNIQNCQNTDDWLRTYSNLVQPVVVVQVNAATVTGRVLGCRQVRLAIGTNIVRATPVTPVGACTAVQQIY